MALVEIFWVFLFFIFIFVVGFVLGSAFKTSLVISNMSLLFLLYSVKGIDLISSGALFLLFVLMNIPLILILLRTSRKTKVDTIPLKKFEDISDRIVGYVIAIILTLYSIEIYSIRDLVLFIFVYTITFMSFTFSNLHYANIFMMFFGYRFFLVSFDYRYKDGLVEGSCVVISKPSLMASDKIRGYRFGDSVIWQKKK